MKRYDLNGRVIAIIDAPVAWIAPLPMPCAARAPAWLCRVMDSLVAELGSPIVAGGWVADVREHASLDSALQKAENHFGNIDVVIAGAGIIADVALEYIDPAAFDRVIGYWRKCPV